MVWSSFSTVERTRGLAGLPLGSRQPRSPR